ncbi:GNAT family N-acetyltransferase [Lichenibacterium minor]|uniref:GNAT family N-acetyltransferase n=1 Tax=Lichenibacterium minor TaxID=2316528 RepID=A0A4Q2UFU4_9HYPH|nr:GNAT family N-acetyltransferase [Lichenibacterium minor]RYC33625.1 GNAT family N-acetyltransferase [Lichenibacterium minor]
MSFETVQLRPAAQVDVPALVRLLQRTWLVAWAPEVPFEAVQMFASCNPAKTHAEDGWPSFTVATCDGVLVGMSHVDADCIEDVHVDPKAWGRGIGAKLMDDAESVIARSHAYARLEVRAFNERARAFYLHRGWTDHRRYPGTECGSPVENFEMRKVLRP